MKRILLVLPLILLLFLDQQKAFAQFREEAFKQNYSTSGEKADTTQRVLSFKTLYRGLSGKCELPIGTLLLGSSYMPGCAQIYNHQSWKLPIFYTGIVAPLGAGLYFNSSKADESLKKYSPWCFAASALSYWSLQMDGMVNFKPELESFPARSTVYAILLPGLGQAANGEYWKIPIYQGGLIVTASLWRDNNVNYQRFRRIYLESMEPGYSQPISSQTALYYRNAYRRIRDYMLVGFAAVYLLQVIDANVFAYMGDFEVNDDLSFNITPSLLAQPSGSFACASSFVPGATLSFTF